MTTTDQKHTLCDSFERSTRDESIPLCVPSLTGSEIDYLRSAIDDGWMATGPHIGQFERDLARFVGSAHGVATSSGTAALHVALLISGVQPDDEVLVSTLTFVAAANAIRYVGAWPVLMDAEENYCQLDVEKVHEFVERECSARNGTLLNRTTGRRVKAIMPVHILGHPVEMDPIRELANRYGLVVIEDATESLGARYRDRMVGSLGDVACFSFNGNKLITTGGGGMILTSRDDWAEKARYLINQAKDNEVEYFHREIGFNYRLSNIQAAVGCAQLERISEHIASKRATAEYYNLRLENATGIGCPREAPWAFSTYWLYTVMVHKERFGIGSRELMHHLDTAGIQTRPLWYPVHRLPPYAGCQAYQVEVADRLHENGLSLPCSVGLMREQIEKVVSSVHRATDCALVCPNVSVSVPD